MKLSSVTVVAAATSLVSAAPFFPTFGRPDSRNRFGGSGGGFGGEFGGQRGGGRVSGGGGGLAGGSNSNALGAAFFMTNEPSGNFVVASNIGSDGKLTFASAVPTLGRGLHGLSSDNGPDGLFSQDSVKVGGQNLFVTNPGSDTLSMFSIDPNEPSNIQMVGGPVSTEGEFPIAVAFDEKSNQVCVLNGGAVNGVSCYTADQQQGLVQIPNTIRSLGLNQTTPASGPAGTASDLLFTADGSKLIASVKGNPPAPGFFAVWNVANDGSLSADFQGVTPPKGGLLPFGMSLFPENANALISTDAAQGFDVIDLNNALSAKAQGTTGIQSAATSNVVAAGESSANVVSGQVAVCWSAFSPKTGDFYMTDIGTSTVTEVNVDKQTLKAKIVKQFPLAPGSATIDDAIGTIQGNDFLYVLAPNVTSVNVLSLEAAGQAKTIQTLNFAESMASAKVTINPKNLQGMALFIK